ncbi:hypothetical protein K437DRAFT_258399 [Tilletiaria anomala UBC 951]|uniref:MARVEL domain-containing protein n=1 Tax=Tilletiaria anomala (strain ATCC 24038 / CBS 436.72 / UBC 951) TaxID=1037660 RepID=A0A066VLJ0_TILAU|nr:uncharacterized protein K437DRAFT_258399 [Tilletiaria anomala UBC 951]KDN41158.1 hypothetical protein K437DRAFT_258399 [Tilletiaria anomala UBC 951]
MPYFMSFQRMANKLNGNAAGPSGGAKESRFGTGIGSQGPVNTANYTVDFLPTSELIARGVQIVLGFIFLIVAIVLSSFQSKWLGAPSGLSGFLLFIALLNIIVVFAVTAIPFAHERSGFNAVKRPARLLREGRVNIILNGIMAIITGLCAMVQTISTTTSSACKNPANDPSVGKQKGSKDDYISALGSFCTSKRAETAFAWFLVLSWIATLVLFLRVWRVGRKNGPRIPPFQHPIDDSAFEPIQYTGEDVDEDDDRGDYAGISHRYGEGGDGRYGAGAGTGPGAIGAGRYDDNAPGIPGSYGSGPTGRDNLDQRNHNPFADQNRVPAPVGYPAQPPAYGGPPRQSYDYGAYGGGMPAGDGGRPY